MESMDIKTKRRMVAILRVLHEAPDGMGSERIAKSLDLSGIQLSERAVRNYLAMADELGWTENLGRGGRRLTPRGIEELEGALVADK
ncbi:MAG TPA: winged-helix domain-containing protein, partial [Candidatus Hydrogenedentes bacterium]|nr:winged-helix domain-containing protein [Candidatus Hydrogenedentota bacterium]